MRFLSLLAALFVTTNSAYFHNNEVENPFLDANCQCTCNCKDAPEQSCDLDLYILLDSAVCVKDIWDEMKFRVNLLVKTIDEEFAIGQHVRVSVMSYANNVSHDVKIDATMDGKPLNYYQLSEKIDKLRWMNEGSYLDNGLEFMKSTIRKDMAGASGSISRRRAALMITNGKSHQTLSGFQTLFSNDPKPFQEWNL